MAMTWRTGGLFAAGLLVGVAVGGWAVLQAHDRAVWQDGGSTHAMGNAAAAPAAQAASTAAGDQAHATPASAPAAAVVPATVAAQSCDDTAIVAKGSEDGKESLHSAPSAASTSEVASLLLTGKEAAASGRMRDAEIVFLNACRDAQAVHGKDAALSLADAMYQLGRHYANVAQAKGARKGELLARSQRLYQAALQTYQAHYGAKGEKTRFAQQGLATVQRLAGGAALPSPVVAQAPAPAARPEAVKQAPRHDEQPTKPSAPVVAVARPDKPRKQAHHELREKQESTAAVAEPSPPPHPAPARHPEVVEARAVPAAGKAQPAAHAPKPVHDETAAHDDSPAVASAAQRSKPAAHEPSSSASADSMPSPHAQRPARDTTRSADAQDADSSGPQASAERPRPPARRTTSPAIATRPSPSIETRPAPPRDEPRHVPRGDDSAADQAPPGTASGTPTAEGSPGDPP